MIFRRARFARRDLAPARPVRARPPRRDPEAAERLDAYNRAERDEAEELYGDYVDAVETGTEILADIRDAYARTLEEGIDEQYEREFNRAVAKRLPPFALEIENR